MNYMMEAEGLPAAGSQPRRRTGQTQERSAAATTVLGLDVIDGGLFGVEGGWRVLGSHALLDADNSQI